RAGWRAADWHGSSRPALDAEVPQPHDGHPDDRSSGDALGVVLPSHLEKGEGDGARLGHRLSPTSHGVAVLVQRRAVCQVLPACQGKLCE
ncbi:unnamed protein product, partial [Ectocarpus sp. 6 AP-2014]